MDARSSSPSEHLSAARLLAYAAPTVALQAMLVPMYNFLPPVYYDVGVGLPAALVGLMFFAARIWEAITDPLIGALSDRTRHRLGKRRIWMLLGTPIAVISAWFLVNPAPGASALYLFSLLVVFYLGWTMVYVPHQTWGSELASGYHERTRIAGFRETGAFVGYLAAAVVPLVYWKWLNGVPEPGFTHIVEAVGVFFMIVLPLGVAWCFARVPAVDHGGDRESLGWRQLFRILVRNKPFARLFGAYVVDRVAMGTYFAAQPALIFQAYGLGGSILWVAITISIAAASLAPLWVPIARRIGKHRAYCAANGVTLVSYVLLYFVPDGNLTALLAVVALMGLGNGGTMILPPAMTADAIDNDRLIAGVEQAGGHMAFLAFAFKFGMGIGALVGLGLLGFFGYASLAQTLDPALELNVRLVAGWLPALLLLVPIAVMWRYPIDSARHAQIRAALDARGRASPV